MVPCEFQAPAQIKPPTEADARLLVLSDAERHALQRLPAQFLPIRNAVRSQGDECLAERDLQFIGLVIFRCHMCIERLPHRIERLVDGIGK